MKRRRKWAGKGRPLLGVLEGMDELETRTELETRIELVAKPDEAALESGRLVTLGTGTTVAPLPLPWPC